MRFASRTVPLRSVIAGSFAALALSIASCSRSDGPTAPVDRPKLKLDCVADVQALTLTCPGLSSTAAGLSLNVTLGGQGTNIQLTSTNVQYSAATSTFSADVTLQNLIEQPIGTSDGISTDPDGIRVFFHSGPTTTGGSGPVVVKNPDGDGSFTGPQQDFFQYLTMLEPGQISGAKNWQWLIGPSVTAFTFSVYVDAPVEHQGDHVDVDPRSIFLPSNEYVQAFTGVRRRVNGDVLPGPAVTWSSSDPAVASIDPNSGELTTHAEGDITITATSGTLSGTAHVVVYAPTDDAPTVTSVDPANTATGVALNAPVEIVFSENVTVTTSSFALSCGGTPHPFTLSGSSVQYWLTPDSDYPKGATCQVNVIGANVSDEDGIDPANMAADFSSTFNTLVNGVDDDFSATSNVLIVRSASNGPLANDGVSGATVSEVNGSAGNVGVWTNTQSTGRGGVAGRVMLSSDGSMQYDPAPGWSGFDQITYRMTKAGSTSELMTVTFNVSPIALEVMWFVCDGCASSDLGTWTNPFTSVATFNAANDASSWAPQNRHSVFIEPGTYDGSSDLLVLRNDQKVYGSAIAPSSVYAADPNSDPAFFAMGPSTSPTIAPRSGNVVALAQNNTIRGVTLAPPATDRAILGSSFGTLTVGTLAINGAGAALDLTDGTLDGSFTQLRSTGGVFNIRLEAVNSSSMLTFGGPSDVLGGAALSAILVLGGNIQFTVPGSVVNTANATLDVRSHTGAITLSGSVTGSNGGSLQFDNADGTYTFTGSTTINGSSNGIRINNGSSGTFSFGSATSIGATTSTSASAFRVAQSNPQVTYSGTLRQTNAGILLVDIADVTSGTITFQTGALTATTGAGILLSNANGTVNFNGPVTMSGGDAGIDVLNGSTGTITFTNVNVSGISGIVVNVDGSAPSLTVNGSLASSTHRLVDVTRTSPAPCGTILIGAQLNGTYTTGNPGAGVRVNQCSTGTITFSSSFPKNISSGAFPAVWLTSNLAPVAVNFTNGNLNLQATTGEGIAASGAGSLTVTGSNNIINVSAGRAISMSGFTIPAAGVTFQSVSSSGGTNNVVINSVNGAGSINLGTGALSGSITGNPAFSINGNAVPITYNGSITKTLPGQIVFVGSQAANAVTFGGNLDCNTNCSGISVSGGTGGSTVTFAGASKILNAAAAGVSLGGNGGSTINFTNGGLQLTTATAGFSASGGGTVNVTTGSLPNTISVNGTATPLVVSNITIGANNLNFQSISSTGGAANGILLSNTGSGRLIVSGNGGTCNIAISTGCTGGVIQNTLADGISLVSTTNPSFSFMKVASTGSHGISGSGVVGMTLDNVVIDNAGNGANENALNFTTGASALTGTVNWTGIGVNEPAANGAFITNTGGTLTINVTNSTFQNAAVPSPTGGVVTGGDLLRFTAAGTATITVIVTSSAFHFPQVDGISAYANGGVGAGTGGTMNLTVSGSSFRGSASTFGGRNAIFVQGIQGGVARFNISSNGTVTRWISDAVSVAATDNANVQGAINSNTIGEFGVLQSGSRDSRGISVVGQGAATLIASVTNNMVRETWRNGILAIVTTPLSGTPSLHAHITGNTIPGIPRAPFAVDNLLFQRDVGNACAHVASNVVSVTTAGGFLIRLLGSGSSGSFSQQGGPANATDAQATSYLQSQNSAGSNVSATNAFTLWTNTACTSPIVP